MSESSSRLWALRGPPKTSSRIQGLRGGGLHKPTGFAEAPAVVVVCGEEQLSFGRRVAASAAQRAREVQTARVQAVQVRANLRNARHMAREEIRIGWNVLWRLKEGSVVKSPRTCGMRRPRIRGQSRLRSADPPRPAHGRTRSTSMCILKTGVRSPSTRADLRRSRSLAVASSVEHAGMGVSSSQYLVRCPSPA